MRLLAFLFIAILIVSTNAYAIDVYAKFNISIYSTPSFDGEVIGEVPKNEKLQVISNDSGWYKVNISTIGEGWVAKKWVTDDLQTIVEKENRRELEKARMIKDLEEKAKNIPASDAYSNLKAYEELLRLDPSNKIFIEKNALYKEKVKSVKSFRETSWGMNQSDVIKAETIKLKPSNNRILIGYDYVAGMKSKVVYIFTNDILTRAKYMFEEEHTNNNDYIVDYNSLKGLLIAKYGIPKASETIWKNSLYKSDPEHHGLALTIGHTFYYAKWEMPGTELLIVLNGDNHKANLVIEYYSVFHKNIVEKEDTKKALEKL